MARFLKVSLSDLKFMLVSTTNMTRGEIIQRDYKVDAAEDNRDAIAKVGWYSVWSRVMVFLPKS